MGQTIEQIEAHIGEAQNDLQSNLQELEQKVKSAVDWKQQFQANPATMIGVAFTAGIVLAAMMGGSRRRRAPRRYSSAPEPTSYSSAPNFTSRLNVGTGKAMETWDHVKSALLGVAATRLTSIVEDIVPGFQEHFKQASQNKNNVHSTQGNTN